VNVFKRKKDERYVYASVTGGITNSNSTPNVMNISYVSVAFGKKKTGEKEW